MISTMDTPVKVRLPTTITIAGSHHQQIVHIQLNPHNRNIMGRAYASLFQNPLTQSMNPSVPIPKVHQIKGLTGRKIEKMAWAPTLLWDPETLRTYEDFAREAAYEMEDTQPQASTPPTHRAQHHPTPPTRHKRTELPNPSQEGTSTGTTSMYVDPYLPEGTTPTGTPSKTTTPHTNKTAPPQWTHPRELPQTTSSPPSTRSHKKLTTPRPTPTA